MIPAVCGGCCMYIHVYVQSTTAHAHVHVCASSVKGERERRGERKREGERKNMQDKARARNYYTYCEEREKE